MAEINTLTDSKQKRAMVESSLARLTNILPVGLRRHKLIQWMIRLFPQEKCTTFKFNELAYIIADLTDAAARQALITRVFEPEFFALAESLLLPETAFFDVGANNGFCTFGLAASRRGDPQMTYHLFEANQHLCETLRLSARLYREEMFWVQNACVTDQPGFSSLQIDPNHWGGSYISQEASGQKVGNIVLDDYIQQKGISVASLVKMDIEGYEIHAVKGMEKSIRRGTVGALYVECSSENLSRQDADVDMLLNLLRSFGCSLFWCKEQDFAAGYAKDSREVVMIAGKPPIRLAPVGSFPEDYQTDIIAIPSSGPFGTIKV